MQENSDNQQHNSGFRVRFWGVRGSYPTSSPNTLKFGGHTSCVEVQAGGNHLIFDAGTGIIPLGKTLLQIRQFPLCLHLFLSHTHHDHLIGLYFFEPLLKATTNLSILGPNSGKKSLRSTLQAAMDRQFFPIGLEDLKAQKSIHSLDGGETVRIKAGRWKPRVERTKTSHKATFGGVTVHTHKSPAHPRNGVLLYRVDYQNRSVVYATDVEEKKGGYPDIIDFIHGADLLIHDAQYVNSEYFSTTDSRRGWGHSTAERAVEVAKKGEVKQLVLFHHEPIRGDKDVLKIEKRARRLFPASIAAYEGLEFNLLKGAK